LKQTLTGKVWVFVCEASAAVCPGTGEANVNTIPTRYIILFIIILFISFIIFFYYLAHNVGLQKKRAYPTTTL
jgi:hypothetical protein